MSASREKKQRQGNPEVGQAQKLQKEQKAAAAKRKTIGYSVLAIVIAVLVAILLLWNSGVFTKKGPAAVINGQEFSAEDLSYYYQSAVNEEYYFYSQYSMFGLTMPFNLSQPLSEQIQDEASGKTWQEYFQESALETLKQTTALCDAANAAGYTISAAGQSYIDQMLQSIDNAAAQNGMSRSTYLGRAYGVSEKVFTRNLSNYALARDYQDAYYLGLSYDDAALNAYYAENTDAIDSYDFRLFYIDGTAANPVDEEGKPLKDEEGNTVTATDAEKKAAMAAAKEKAEEAAAAVKAAEDREQAMIDLAPNYVDEGSKENYTNNPDASLVDGMVGNTLSYYSYAEWLQDDSRKTGDVTVTEDSSGYYVILFLDRYLNEASTVNYTDILVTAALAETDDETTADVDESKVPTQDALDTARAACEMMLSQWEAGDKTAESFGVLMAENSVTNSYTYVQPGLNNKALNDWLFDSARKAGDTAILEETQSGQHGWHLVYFQGQEAPYWNYTAIQAMKSADLADWLEEKTAPYEAVIGEGMVNVGY